MDTEFDAENFVARLRLGEFDFRLNEVLRKLSAPQLEKVADILMDETTNQNRLDSR